MAVQEAATRGYPRSAQAGMVMRNPGRRLSEELRSGGVFVCLGANVLARRSHQGRTRVADQLFRGRGFGVFEFVEGVPERDVQSAGANGLRHRDDTAAGVEGDDLDLRRHTADQSSVRLTSRRRTRRSQSRGGRGSTTSSSTEPRWCLY